MMSCKTTFLHRMLFKIDKCDKIGDSSWETKSQIANLFGYRDNDSYTQITICAACLMLANEDSEVPCEYWSVKITESYFSFSEQMLSITTFLRLV